MEVQYPCSDVEYLRYGGITAQKDENSGGASEWRRCRVARAMSDIPHGHPQTNQFATNKLILFLNLPVLEAVLASVVFIGPQINLPPWTNSKPSERTSGKMT